MFDPNRRLDKHALIAALEAAGAQVKSDSTILCPFHDDHRPSAGIYQNGDGSWKFHCREAKVCGVTEDVYGVEARAAGKVTTRKKPSMSLNASKPPAPAPSFDSIAKAVEKIQPVDTYTYKQPGGKIDLVILRTKNKQFYPLTQNTAGKWELRNNLAVNPLLNLPAIASAKPDTSVLFVEGEKCVKYLYTIGVLATTAPGGAGQGLKADYSPLAGRTVIVWPDNDDAGRTHAGAVKRQLEELDPPATVWMVNLKKLPELQPKWGCDDYLLSDPATDKRALLEATIQDAALLPLSASEELGNHISAIADGKVRTVKFPFECLTNLAKALKPGTTTVLGGDPGASKSLLLVQCLRYWIAQGVKCAAYMLEDDRKVHEMRALAQLSGQAGMTDEDWIEANPHQALEYHDNFRLHIDYLGKAMWDAPDKQITYPEMTRWVEDRLKAGCRIVCIDPVTALAEEDERRPWNEHLRFILETRTMLRKYGASLLCITHPRTGGQSKGKGVDDLAGGRAWGRFVQTVLWLSTHPKGISVTVYRKGEENGAETECNRKISIWKARNGKGTGIDIAYWFEKKGLFFEERGTIISENKERKKK